MRIFLILTFLAFLIRSGVSQSIALSTQEDVDNFPSVYGSLDTIHRLIIGVSLGYPSTDIENLDSLKFIVYIRNELNIQENDSLESLRGLQNLTGVGRYVRIQFNQNLMSIDHLSGLDSVGNFISLYNNPTLTDCAISLICEMLKNSASDVFAHQNGPGCSGAEEIADSCKLKCECPPGISFETQSEINAFSVDYPDCNKISGNVFISGVDITNLDSLISIQKISGGLSVLSNPTLSSLGGLESLDTVENFIQIYENHRLTDLHGLNELTFCGSNFSIHMNDSLADLTGLDNLNRIEGQLSVSSNKNLHSISSLNSLLHCYHMSIYSNDSLKYLNGLGNLDTIRYSAIIAYNPTLQHFNGFTRLKYVGLDLSTDISSLAGLDSLVKDDSLVVNALRKQNATGQEGGNKNYNGLRLHCAGFFSKLLNIWPECYYTIV